MGFLVHELLSPDDERNSLRNAMCCGSLAARICCVNSILVKVANNRAPSIFGPVEVLLELSVIGLMIDLIRAEYKASAGGTGGN